MASVSQHKVVQCAVVSTSCLAVVKPGVGGSSFWLCASPDAKRVRSSCSLQEFDLYSALGVGPQFGLFGCFLYPLNLTNQSALLRDLAVNHYCCSPRSAV